jgi:hypothetical protein
MVLRVLVTPQKRSARLSHNAEISLVETNSALGWVRWYFTARAITLLTGPLFFMLSLAFLDSATHALFQTIAFLRVTHAVFGALSVMLVAVFGLLGLVPLILPPILFYSLLRNLPGLWPRRDAPRRHKLVMCIVVLVGLTSAALIIQRGTGLGIGWIADRTPCAASRSA